MRTLFQLLSIVALCLSFMINEANASTSWQNETFERLKNIRIQKKEAIITRLNDMQQKAQAALNDPILVSFFNSFKNTPAKNRSIVGFSDQAEFNFDRHYVEAYAAFYDILFIDQSGFIFHSVKQEDDYHKNLFLGELKKTQLSKHLRENPNTNFVDYDYYAPSKEAASFFITPIKKSGWMVFQFSINDINTALSDYQNLGSTGEIYLTNTKHMMITQSRLLAEDTVLKQKVDTKASNIVTHKGQGNQVLRDYRGVRVFSSYEPFEFSGAKWAIIAEIDQAEVITEYYKKNKDTLIPTLFKNLEMGKKINPAFFAFKNNTKRIDINEFGRGNVNDKLVTYGVSTCTAIVISKPKVFSYLGHIYPLDDAYQNGYKKVLTDLGLKLRGSTAPRNRDLLGQMLRKIKHFDVRPAELHDINITIAAVHTKSLEIIIDKLIEKGFFLSQIQVLYAPKMRSVNLSVLVKNNTVALQWNPLRSNKSVWTRTQTGHFNLERLVKSILQQA